MAPALDAGESRRALHRHAQDMKRCYRSPVLAIRPMMQEGAAAGATKRQWAKTGLALGTVSHATEFLFAVF